VVAWWSYIVLVSAYYGRLLLLHLIWMIVLLGRVSWGWSYFHSVLKRPQSMFFMLLRFLLRNLLWFWWVYLCLLLVFSSLTAFNILSLVFVLVDLMIICLGGSSILVKSVWCSGGFLYLNGHSFLCIWDVFCYHFVEYIINSFCLHLFPFFNDRWQTCGSLGWRPGGLVGGWQPTCSFSVSWSKEAFNEIDVQGAEVSALPCALLQPSVSLAFQKVLWFPEFTQSASVSQSPFFCPFILHSLH
jgi:hypothetical protein